ncbi:unnamed protein product [Musa hybrid cultivar]
MATTTTAKPLATPSPHHCYSISMSVSTSGEASTSPRRKHQHHQGVRTLPGRDYYCRPVRLPVDMPGQHWFGNAVHIFAGVEAYRQPPGVPARESIRCTTLLQSLQLGIPHQRHRQLML